MMSPGVLTRRALLKGAAASAAILAAYPGARLVRAQGNAEYDLIDLGAFDVEVTSGPETGFGSLNGINDLGETCGVVGAAEDRFSPAVWSAGGRRRRLRSAQLGGGANAINNAGEVAGFEYVEDLFRPTVWRDNEPVRLPDLDGEIEGARGVAATINNNGIVAGQVRYQDRAQAVRWVDDVAEMLPEASLGHAQRAFDINDNDVIVATIFIPGIGASEVSAFYRGDDITLVGYRDVPAVIGTRVNMVPRKMNNNDQAIFQVTPASGGGTPNPAQYYFFVDNGREFTMFQADDGIARFGTDLNDDGLIVGSIETLSTPPQAVLWRDGEMIELQSLAPPDTGLALLRSAGVNNAGMIAAFGRDEVAGLTHGVLLVPVT